MEKVSWMVTTWRSTKSGPLLAGDHNKSFPTKQGSTTCSQRCPCQPEAVWLGFATRVPVGNLRVTSRAYRSTPVILRCKNRPLIINPFCISLRIYIQTININYVGYSQVDLSNTRQHYLEEPEAKSTILPRAVSREAVQARLSALLDLAAAISLGGMVFLIPLRYKVFVQPRLIPPIYSDYTDFIVYLPDIFLVATLLFWQLSIIFHRRKIQTRPLWLTIPLAGLTLVAGLSSLDSVDQSLSLYHLARLFLLFGLFLFVINHANSYRIIVIAAGAQLVSQAIIGITQVLQQHSLGLIKLQELALDPKWRGVSIVWSWAGTSLRAYGLTDHPNILGGCLALALIFIIATYLKTHGRSQILLLGIIQIGLTALLLSFSRSAWLGLAAGSTVMFAWLVTRRRKENLKDMAVLGVVSLLIMAPLLWQNATYLGIRLGANQSFTDPTPENQALNERVILDRMAISIFQLHPGTGTGLGTFPIALSQFKPDYPFNLQPPHFVFLDVIAETGALGGLFYLLLEFLPWVFLLKNVRRFTFSIDLIAISAALLAISVISLFDYYPWMLDPGRLWQWLLWGLWGSAWMIASKRSVNA